MAKKIAIIDDDQNICRFLGESLKLRGYLVDAFPAADPGLPKILEGGYDLALLDVLLPGLSGLDICRELRSAQQTARLPIILMTAFQKEARHIRQAREEYGASDYLLKPFSLATLHDKVRDLIGTADTPAAEKKFRVEGSLADIPLPQLLHNLYTLKTTGLLHLERSDLKKVVYIKDGYPIFVRSNLLSECLGPLLVREGLITQAQSDDSLAQGKTSDRRQGTVLIEMGLLSPPQLHELLSRQVNDKLLEGFAWADGNYRFVQVRNFKEGVTVINLSPAEMILQGIRRHFADSQVAAILKPHRQRYLLQTENPHYRFQDLRLSRRETEFLALCRGHQTLENLLGRYPLSRHENEQLLAALLIAEVIESREIPVAGGSFAPEPGPTPIDKQQLRESVLADYARLMPLDHFALLGVARNASTEEIRHNYFNLAKQYHPDHFQRQYLSPDLLIKVNQLFQRIGAAYHLLTDPVARRDYTESLGGKTKPHQIDVSDILQAETAFQKGLVFLRTKNYHEALEAFAWSIKLNPKEPEYLTQYAWAKFKCNPTDKERLSEALQALQLSLDLNHKLDKTHLYLGYLLKESGREAEAEKRFEKAIKCNPNCTEALRELRLMNMRRGNASGLFDRVFKK